MKECGLVTRYCSMMNCLLGNVERGPLPPSLPLSSSIELSSFSTSNRSNTNVVEGGVSFVVTDETNPNWQSSRFNFVLPLSTSIDSLHTQVAYDAGMIGLLIR